MDQSVERLLEEIRQGNDEASKTVYEEFACRIRNIARQRLAGRLQYKISADDVVQSVFKSFFRRNQLSQFQCPNWNALWGLLAKMAEHKCNQQFRRFHSSKRDVSRESEFPFSHASSPDNVPSPDQVVALQDVVAWSLGGMTDFQRDVILLRLSGLSNLEIAQTVERTERTIFRIIKKFRLRIASQL